MEDSQLNIYFEDSRLKLTFVGRFLVRLVIYIVYGFIAASAISLIAFYYKEQNHLFWLGIFLSLFLGDRFLDYKKADYSLREFRFKKNNFNLAKFLTPASCHLIEHAFDKSLLTAGDFYLYLLKNLLKKNDINEALIRLDAKPEEVFQKVDEYLKKSIGKTRQSPSDLLNKVQRLVRDAYQYAFEAKELYIEPRNLLVAVILNSPEAARLFDLFFLKASDFKEALIFGRYKATFRKLTRLPATLGGFAPRRGLRKRIMNRAWTARPTPTLDQYSVDLTNLARSEEIGFLIGHENEYRLLVNSLSRLAKPNTLLIGEPGAGKSTLVAHLAFQIVSDEVPEALFDKRLVSLELGGLVASATPEEVAGRFKKIIEEIIRAGNIILYIPDIDNLVKTSGSGFLSAADILLPEIKSGTFPVIGGTYPREYKQLIEPQSDFAGAFEVVRIEEVSEEEAVRILVYASLILEKQFKIFITFGAVRQAAMLARKFFRLKLLPSSAEDLLKESLAEASGRKEKILTAQIVNEVAERRTKVPIQRAGRQEAEKLLKLEEIIHQKLINQNEAVKAVSRALREYRSGLSRSGGPIAAFLFVGPTGVGKTELAKILSELQFGSEDMMIRFDMSEFQDKQSFQRFIGTPDGSVSGMLTEAVLARPYSLILLDEFEKAHPDILNLFLQVFDDGRLTDNLGRTVDFQNTIIIATSNACSDFIKEEIEKKTSVEKLAIALKKKLTEYFRPELLNRFSDVIVFRNLTLEEIRAVAELHLSGFAKMLRETQGIEISFDSKSVAAIAEWGYDPVFGARPLRKVISERVKSVIAERILKKELGRGNSLAVSLKGDDLEFKLEN